MIEVKPIEINWHNLTTMQLVDTYAVTSREARKLQAQCEKMREELLFRHRRGETLKGRRYTIEPEEGEQRRLDTDALKAEFGAAWYDKHCIVTPVVKLLVKVRDSFATEKRTNHQQSVASKRRRA
jgi:hypothetical protein